MHRGVRERTSRRPAAPVPRPAVEQEERPLGTLRELFEDTVDAVHSGGLPVRFRRGVLRSLCVHDLETAWRRQAGKCAVTGYNFGLWSPRAPNPTGIVPVPVNHRVTQARNNIRLVSWPLGMSLVSDHRLHRWEGLPNADFHSEVLQYYRDATRLSLRDWPVHLVLRANCGLRRSWGSAAELGIHLQLYNHVYSGALAEPDDLRILTLSLLKDTVCCDDGPLASVGDPDLVDQLDRFVRHRLLERYREYVRQAHTNYNDGQGEPLCPPQL